MHSIEAAFYKVPDLSYQREYRLAFDINAEDDKAVCLEIGDISDISFIPNYRPSDSETRRAVPQ